MHVVAFERDLEGRVNKFQSRWKDAHLSNNKQSTYEQYKTGTLQKTKEAHERKKAQIRAIPTTGNSTVTAADGRTQKTQI